MDRFAHYRWPFFEPRHAKLAEEAEHFSRESLTYAHGDDADAICRRLVQDLGCAGYLRHCATETPDVRCIAILREVFAYRAGLADFAFVMQGLGSGPIALAGSSELKNKYLLKAASGDAIAAFALSEPDAGSDVQALTTSARRQGGAWTVDASERIDIVAPHPMATLKLKAAKGLLIGEAGQGFKLAMRNLDIFRTTVAAAALGFARRALDEALSRSRQRRMFGQKLADFQMTQAKLADMATLIEAGALLTYKAGWMKDGKRRVTRDAAMAKMFATEAAQQVIDDAVQICGGLGVMRGHPVERLYREVRALRIYEGATEVQKLIIAKDLLAS
jgi:acyl-CoA dehydrogenase